MIFNELLNYNTAACYVIIDHRLKQAYVIACKNFILSAANQAYLISNQQHSKIQLNDTIQGVFLQAIDIKKESLEAVRLKWINHYKDLGYDILNTRVPKYKIRIKMNKEGKAEVQIVSAGRRLYRIKQFDKYDKALEYANNTSIERMMQQWKNQKILK